MENNSLSDLSNLLADSSYSTYTILYGGTAKNKTYLYNNNNIAISIIDGGYAIALLSDSVIKNKANTKQIEIILNENVKNDGLFIYYVAPPEVYTLLETSAIEASEVSSVQSNLPLDLRGNGVTVGIIDTGIDYLNEEFLDENGKSRVNYIWDQSLSPLKGENVTFGRVFDNNEINNAINLKNNGGDPYSIVSSVDEVGHGTHMAGIVGASGKNPELRGMAPECEFVIVKLRTGAGFIKVFPDHPNLYNLGMILSAIKYIYDYTIKFKKPTVILLPLGSNSGNHQGKSLLDSYIQSISVNVGIVVTSGAGNEGISDGHVSGRIENVNECQTIELIVAPDQGNMLVELWIDLPNIADVEIISPSGQTTGVIPAILNSSKEFLYTFEQTTISTFYYIPEEFSGDELIRIYLYNIQSGIWRIKLCLRLGSNAKYNAWLLQSGLSKEGTRFTPSDPYGTITSPSDAPIVITAAAYNQNNNYLLSYSGVSFRDQYINNIDFAAGGVNTKTVGLNNTIDIINGSSLAAAIGAGACVLLFEWGIVKKNYPYMYALSMKTFLSRGAIQRKGDSYPNPQWGYGILNIYNLFQNLQ